MASRLKNIRQVDPVLTNLAIGYSNNEMIGEFLMPIVDIDKEAAQIPVFGKEAFRLYNTIRGIRADSNRMNPDGIQMIDVAVDEHDIEYPIDYREDAESAFDLQAHATHATTEIIQVRREHAISKMVQDPFCYHADNNITLSGSSMFSDPTSDVIGVFDDGKKTVSGKIGKDPNRLALSYDTYQVLRHHPQLVEMMKYNKGGRLKLQDLQDLLEFEEIKVGRGIFADAEDNFQRFWENSAAMAYVPKSPSQKSMKRSVYQPSFGYTVRRKGNPKVDVYTDQGGKLQIVRNTDIFRPYMLGADAGYLINNTVG